MQYAKNFMVNIPVDNPERTQKFYSDMFNWKFKKQDNSMNYWMVKTGIEQSGINDHDLS